MTEKLYKQVIVVWAKNANEAQHAADAAVEAARTAGQGMVAAFPLMVQPQSVHDWETDKEYDAAADFLVDPQ